MRALRNYFGAGDVVYNKLNSECDVEVGFCVLVVFRFPLSLCLLNAS